MNNIRKNLEACSCLEGFIFTHSLDGSFSSSLVNAVMNDLIYNEGMSKKIFANFTIFPNDMDGDFAT
jgi:hypothetical protein